MKLGQSLTWMFVGSVIIGIFLNGMNILAYRYDDLYLSLTLIYSALLMASNMCILELLMYYSHTGKMNWALLIAFIVLTGGLIYALRQQICVNDDQWLKRMISHHSTALTTSHKIYKKTRNDDVKRLAKEIIDTQEKEIVIMKQLLK